ncbi:acetyl-lysine deacetylase [Halovivax asiaticus JCM 14624]|uniref:Putative [LysW]-lysine/[LysW]-ornithine hydrolase n=1 Tax=Halovivax asiaticus JCM 14624 TaxID=1227490 RepID=M0BMN5_9EURY|nr:[LysW]-lysine hydrolase [Halovivax asiaticus]ELZ11543.1 acetyl-lysine deacetylase [Halovivax asiaticus JCM 14624]
MTTPTNAHDTPAVGTDVSTETARELLVDMVSTPSVSGDEGTAAERLATFFDAHDREVWLDDVGNVRAPADDAVLFTSHVDTVPGDVPVRLTANGEAAESDAVAAADEELDLDDAATVDDADLWGRGSVDATGPLCAMAVAAVRTGSSFAGVVGEETDSRGARHLVETREPPAAVVNGEPSGVDGITLGYRGLVAGTYAATTDSTHASRPEPTAVQDAMAWWAAVESACDALISPGDDSTVPDSTLPDQSTFESVTSKPVAIEGGPADGGLSVEARVDFQVRVPPGLSVETVESTLASVTADFAGGLELADAIAPVMASPRTPVARAFRVAIREADGDPRLLRKTGTSDMNVFAAAWDRPMATYGPGDSSLDHAPDEHLSLAAYDRSIAVLDAVGQRLVDVGQSNRPPTTHHSPTDSDPQ